MSHGKQKSHKQLRKGQKQRLKTIHREMVKLSDTNK